MRNLHLGDLLLILRDLATARKTALGLSVTGKLYAKKLAKQQAQIEALPEALRGGRPLAQQLADKDDEHDGYGEAIYYYAEAILALPIAPEEAKDAAKRVRDAFVPRLSTLRAAYADEAAAAAKKRPALDKLKNDLKSLAVPFPAGATMIEWATAFLDAGDGLDKLLSNRAAVSNESLPAPVAKIRTSTIALLGRFRAALIDEIEEDEGLPRDLEAQLFGYLDELQQMREQAAAGRVKAGKDEGGEQGQGGDQGKTGG